MIFLVVLFFVVINSAPLPYFTRFNLNSSKTGYIINGTIYQNLGPSPVPTTLVMDPKNNRMMLDLSGNGGKFVITKDAAYIFGQPFLEACTRVIGWNYALQVASFAELYSLPGSKTHDKSEYTGLARGFGSCLHDVSYTIRTKEKGNKGDVIFELDFAQRIPVQFSPTNNTCFNALGITEYDMNTVDFTSNRDAYFQLPTSCTTNPIDYCALIYPPNNPCTVPQKKRSIDV